MKRGIFYKEDVVVIETASKDFVGAGEYARQLEARDIDQLSPTVIAKYAAGFLVSASLDSRTQVVRDTEGNVTVVAKNHVSGDITRMSVDEVVVFVQEDLPMDIARCKTLEVRVSDQVGGQTAQQEHLVFNVG